MTNSPDKLAKSAPSRLDQVLWGVILGLGLAALGLVWSGSHTLAWVRHFSWQDRVIDGQERAFILEFSRPMNQASVAANLQVDPPLGGTLSWAGRRLAYTLSQPAPYGQRYQITLAGARDLYGAVMQPFRGQFKTPDQAFAYIGVTGQEQGRLILYNFTRQYKQVLTPPNLSIVRFQPYPRGDKLLFAALPPGQLNLSRQQLYSVTTGLDGHLPGHVELVLDNRAYDNLQFELSPDGQTIVVQRASHKDLAAPRLWVLRPHQPPQPLNNKPGGDFKITPDGTDVVVAQGQGVAVLPLQPQAEPLDFLARFGQVLNFSADGTQAAMVQFNQDYTRSLYLVTNQGVQKQLLRTGGTILQAIFDPTGHKLYCLFTQRLAGVLDREQPSLVVINPATDQVTPLVLLPPDQMDWHLSLSGDGLQLLLSESHSTQGYIWLLPLATQPGQTPQLAKLEVLPFLGAVPQWLS